MESLEGSDSVVECVVRSASVVVVLGPVMVWDQIANLVPVVPVTIVVMVLKLVVMAVVKMVRHQIANLAPFVVVVVVVEV